MARSLKDEGWNLYGSTKFCSSAFASEKVALGPNIHSAKDIDKFRHVGNSFKVGKGGNPNAERP